MTDLGPIANALLDGKTKPLADWLRKGRPLDWATAMLLANMLDPQRGRVLTPFRLEVKGRKTNQKGHSETMAAYDRKIEIGGYVEDALRVPGAYYEEVVTDARKRFKVGRTTVTEALAYFRKRMNSVEEIKRSLSRSH